MYKKFLDFFYKDHKTISEELVIKSEYQSKYLIELRQIEKIYHTDADDFTALKGVNLAAFAGEFLAIIGKSGSGKSTLLNMITGVDRPTAGQIMINGTAIHTMQENQMAVWRGRNIGIVFQFFQLLPTLSVVENVMLPMDFCNMYKPAERHARAMSLLEMVKMTDQANKLPTELSGGQQQRVAIVRALANDPPIIVADEPTGNLDSKTADAVFTLFDELVSKGKTILMVSHDSDIEKRVRRAITVADGEIVHETGIGSLL